MNKTERLVPVHKQWVDMIASGDKKYEFRGDNCKNWKTGDTVYLYETLGKKKKGYCSKRNCNEECYSYSEDDSDVLNGISCVKELIPTYGENVPCEGTGKVRLSFVVGERLKLIGWDGGNVAYEDLKTNHILHFKLNDLKEQGFNYQKYAFEITALVVFDEESSCIIKGAGEETEYLTSTGDFCANLKCNYCINKNDAYGICNKPKQSLELTDFISVKKLEDLQSLGCSKSSTCKYHNEEPNYCLNETCYKCDTFFDDNNLRVTKAPQSAMRVIRKVGS